MGKLQHVQKYTEIYLIEGFDVIQVRVFLKDPFVSTRAKAIAHRILQLCEDNDRASQPIFIHGLSVGCYIYAEMLIHMLDNKDGFEDFPDRICGQILDSPVDPPTAPKAFAKATTNNYVAQRFLITVANMYFLIGRKTTRDLYRASEVCKANDNRTPTMLLYSLGDPVFQPEVFVNMIEHQIRKGIDARDVKWESPGHVAIYRDCPEEYHSAVKSFLKKQLTHKISPNSLNTRL